MKILVCVDETDCSKDAIASLSSSDLLKGSSILVAHVTDSANRQVLETATQLVQADAQLLTEGGPASLDILVRGGPVGESLIVMARDWDAELIVLGSHDRRGIEKLLLGSISLFVTERAPCAVMIARRESTRVLGNVLVAVDDSESSAACLDWLTKQCFVVNKNVVLLSVAHQLPASFQTEPSISKSSEMLLQQELEQSRLLHVTERWSELCAVALHRPQVPFVIADGDPIEAILAAANKWPADMIVVGSHSRRGLDKLLHGSISEAIAGKSRCTVMVVPGKEGGEFELARNMLKESQELATVMSEKSHPARVSGSITGTDFNGFMPYNF